MKKEYDFTEAEQGKFYRPKKVQKTIRFDEDIIEHFQNLASEQKIGYQTLINQTLRNAMQQGSTYFDESSLKKALREVIRKELKNRQI